MNTAPTYFLIYNTSIAAHICSASEILKQIKCKRTLFSQSDAPSNCIHMNNPALIIMI